MRLVKKIVPALVLVSAALLSGCGTTTQDRAVSGGLIGAGGGALIAGATGGSVGTGLVVGALAGAVVGAATDPCDLNLGDPFWKEHGGRRGYYHRCGHHHHHHHHHHHDDD